MNQKTAIKICGLTQVVETEYLNRLPVDYAGMVLFFQKSKRNISLEQAAELIKNLRPEIKKVAVVVEPTVEQVLLIEQCGFDILQIHGTVEPEIFTKTSIPIWKAFNVKDLDEIEQFQKNDRVIGYVFDAAKPGSGEVFDWNLLKQIPRENKMVLLAGGLNAENVRQAIEQVRPDGVDVSSAVEKENGQGKDEGKVKKFVTSVMY